MEVELSSNSADYRNALIRWMATFGKNAHGAVRVQGRLLGERLIALTPPHSMSQGKNRVRSDIKKIILGLDDLEDRQIPQYVLKGDTNIIKAFVNKQGVVYGVDKALYRPDASLGDLSKFHQSQRDQRGRIGDAGKFTRDIGRWKFITMMVAPSNRVAEYVALVQNRVGRGRGGWASGVTRLGGRVAQWIAVHARTSGQFKDGTDQPNPSVEFINQSEWAAGGDQDRIRENAINARIRDMNASIRHAIRNSGRALHG